MSDENGQRRSVSGWMRLALFASLAVNLLVVGVVAGALWRGGPTGSGGPRDRDFAAPYARALDADGRGELRRSLRREMLDNRPERGALADGYRAASAALRAEPFDPAALDAALREQAKRAIARQDIGRRVMVDFVTRMSAEERAQFADRLDAEVANLARRLPGRKPDR